MSVHIVASANSADWPSQFSLAAAAVRNGQLVVFPTETVYGIALKADCQSAIDNVYRLKGRPAGKPCAFHVGDWQMLKQICNDLDPRLFTIMKKYLPGPFTFLVDIAGVKTGIRFPQNPIAQLFLSLCDVPVKATSANLSDQPSPINIEMTQDIQAGIAYCIDGGPTMSRFESTVVDLTFEPPRVLRQGVGVFEGV